MIILYILKNIIFIKGYKDEIYRWGHWKMISVHFSIMYNVFDEFQCISADFIISWYMYT